MCTIRRDCEGPTFGTQLRLLCERSGVEVPLILGDILRWLAAHALAQPDVFAQAPKCAVTSQLKIAIDTGASLAELVEGTHPAVVGSLLKRWLEELPDPLLNWDQQVELLSACKDEGCIEARIASLNDAVALVDHISLGTLKPLLLFLQQYCFRQRRFDQQLLQVAVAFAPILFPAALAAGPAELRLAEETVATLVSNALHVFNPTLAANVPVVTPQALCEAAAEIMESQQQSDSCEYVKAAGFHYRQRGQHGAPDICLPLDQQIQLEQADQLNDTSYEPYMHDAPFIASLNVMVDSCVMTALFPLDDHSNHDNAFWNVDDDCGSITSSCSNARLSTGGAMSSGGASSCSNHSAAAHPTEHSHALLSTSHHHHHHSSNAIAAGRRHGLEGAQSEAPYSPRAVLLNATMLAAGVESMGVRAGDTAHNATKTAVITTAVKNAAASVSAALAELAQREVSEGSVFCIISAQPGGALLAASTAANADATAVGKPGEGKSPCEVVAVALHPHQQQALADMAELQAMLLNEYPDAHAAARPTSVRRPTEGGAAITVATSSSEVIVQGHGHGQEPGSAPAMPRPLSRQSSAGGVGEPQQRRMTMGGGEGHVGAAPAAVQEPRQQPKPQHQPVSNPGGTVTVLYQHLPQLRHRHAAGGNSGGANSSSSLSAGGVGPQPIDHLPPPPTSPAGSAMHGGGYVADLGVAGHLRVALTSAHTLVVRELSTPEAMIHRVPIRSLSVPAMQSEKERLKRQLKDVAAAYEVLAGRSLTPALKEPLRPVYVRYHKIKALLSSGRTATYKENQGGATGARAVQKQAPVVSSRSSLAV